MKLQTLGSLEPKEEALQLPPETRTILNALVELRRETRLTVIHYALVHFLEKSVAETAARSLHSPPGSDGTTKLRTTPPYIKAHPSVSSSGPTVSARLADRIRAFAREHYVVPAREKGARTLDIAVRDIHRRMNLTQAYSAVMAALQSRDFLLSNRLELRATQGGTDGSAKVYSYDVLSN